MASVMKQFLSTSYLFGGNAPFVEELYERYLADPASVARRSGARYFDAAAAGLPGATRHGRRARAGRRVLRAAREAAAPRRAARRRRSAVDARSRCRSLHAHPRLPHHRARAGRTSTRSSACERPHDSRARAGVLRPDRGRHGARCSTPGSFVGPERDAAARDPRRRCARPTAARSASSTCTSRDRRRSAGSSSASSRCAARRSSPPSDRSACSSSASPPPRRWSATCTRATSARSASRCEGGETLIPLLDELIQRAGAQGVQEIVIGMAHRGRLNVLVNMLGKMPEGPLLASSRASTAHELRRRRRQVPPGLLVRHHTRRAARCTSRSRSTRRTSRSSTRWSRARCARASTAAATARATRCCRS